ncbi:MAG: SprT-like domain-containing protein, partial [Silvanigrellaceae bacterium]|nr:SprT-like domain-containing protein [Silvanigrellaceae bacterium]
MKSKNYRFVIDEIHSEFRVKWCLKLCDEFVNICYQYGVSLKKPIILVQNLNYIWGDWSSQLRTIRLSENLILKHSWDVVVGVLKHEMAHQIVSEVFHVSQGNHDSYFDMACNLIAVPFEFRKAHLHFDETIPHWKETSSLLPEEELLLKKIEKLLNLSQSSNEHEALRAMEKVQELYGRYNIQRIQEQKTSDFVSFILDFKKKRMERAHSIAASI